MAGLEVRIPLERNDLICSTQMGLTYFFGENDVQKLDSVQDFAVFLKRMKEVPGQLEQVSITGWLGCLG